MKNSQTLFFYHTITSLCFTTFFVSVTHDYDKVNKQSI